MSHRSGMIRILKKGTYIMKNIILDLAQKVMSEMNEAGAVEHNGVTYKESYYRNDYRETKNALFIDGDQYQEFSGDLGSSKISHGGEYLYPDCQCWMRHPSLKDAERFVKIVDKDFFLSLRARVEAVESDAADKINL